ncbi:hypothetical protein Y032_0299g1787 [Ancylostoma ceylanicum]|uniref:RFX-type winged-helix domain-containing protein n=1 Tax=Ancylostoma ceylanicum TaxID=53326 RepID=A0A016S4X0_9BILA|nr:hypothetical protein Y032_0299g1787 [Ancylostoma ceylanicum]
MTPDEFVRIELTPETRLHIQWLLDNYETADGTSLPRCALYDHYKKHCHEHKLDAVNAASFGKLIRSVFNGLRTRRLGTRGNSKYHYYGIRIKADSPLMQAHVPERYSPHEASAPMSRPSLKRPNTAMSVQSSRPASSSPAPRQSPNAPPPSAVNGHSRGEASDTDRLSLGTGEVPFIQTPQTDGLIEALPKLGLELSHVVMFVNAYNHNCSEVLYCVKQLQFEQIEEYWTAFWQPEDDLDDEDKALGQARLSQQQLFSLCTLPQIQHWVVSLDLAFYQTLVDILVPDVLMSNMSPFLTQSCRNFAKNVEHYLKKAMQGAPEIIQKKKIQAVKYMAQGLRRYTSLNHLAQAARAVLQKPDQVTAMYNDYVRILTSVDQALVIPYQCLIDTGKDSVSTPVTCPSNNHALQCSGHGDCTTTSLCVCFAGWAGVACDTRTNSTLSKNRGSSRTIVVVPSIAEGKTLDTATLLGILLLVGVVLLLLLVCLLFCYRRRSVVEIPTPSDEKLDESLPDQTQRSIKFGSMPSWRDEKRRRKSNKHVYGALNRITEADERDSASLRSRESGSQNAGSQLLFDPNHQMIPYGRPDMVLPDRIHEHIYAESAIIMSNSSPIHLDHPMRSLNSWSKSPSTSAEHIAPTPLRLNNIKQLLRNLQNDDDMVDELREDNMELLDTRYPLEAYGSTYKPLGEIIGEEELSGVEADHDLGSNTESSRGYELDQRGGDARLDTGEARSSPVGRTACDFRQSPSLFNDSFKLEMSSSIHT